MAGVNLLAVSAKKVADVATFIKENASAGKLKYATEANVTHRLFFPTHVDENGVQVPYIIAAPVHAWGTGQSYGACICTKNIAVEDTDFDGTCPVCERVADAMAISAYVKAEKEEACTLVGEARKKFLEDLDKQLWQDQKVGYAKQKYYVALIKLACDKDGKALAAGDGAKFTVHIAAWTEKTMQKFLDALTMQDEEPTLAGREFKIKYGDYNDAMTRVGQANVTVVDENKALTREGTPLYTEIMEAMAAFEFEHSVELCRSEVKSQSPVELKVSMNSLFREWDNYKAELAVNPNAKYLEYSTTASAPNANPATEAPSAPEGALTTGAQAGTTGGEVGVDELDAALGLK